MSVAPRGFSLVEDLPQTEAPPPPAQNSRLHAAAVEMLKLALAALGQRFVVALASLYSLLTVGSVFVLWFMTPDPSQTQIISLGLYATFILIVNYLNMRKGR